MQLRPNLSAGIHRAAPPHVRREIVVIAAYNVTPRYGEGHVRLTAGNPLHPNLPAPRRPLDVRPARELVMLAAGLEVVPSNCSRHILVHGEISASFQPDAAAVANDLALCCRFPSIVKCFVKVCAKSALAP